MKTLEKSLRALCALPIALGLAANANAQINVNGSLTAPSVTAADQYFFANAQSDTNNIDGSAVFSANSTGANDGQTYIAGDRPAQGQTFTTGANPLGFDLNSITVRHVDYSDVSINNGTWWNIPAGATWQFAFGTVNGTSLTPTYTATATWTGSALSGGVNAAPYGAGTGTYFTFDLSSANLALAANTTYYFEIASTANPPYFELDGLENGPYAGGTAFTGGTAASLDTVFNADDGDRTFVASMTAVPEPTAAALFGALVSLGGMGIFRRRKRL